MDLNQWLNQVDGKAIEAEDSSNYAQCFDLAFSWCDFLGIPRDSIRHLYAYQIYTNPNPDTSKYWEIVTNTPMGVPPPGALVIWGTGVGVAGHVSIAKEGATTSSFHSEDQNWAGVQIARDVNHSYNYVLGWLRPLIPATGDSQELMQIKKTDFERLMSRSTTLEAFERDNFPNVDSVHKAIDDLVQAGRDKDGDIKRLNGNISDLNAQILDLKKRIDFISVGSLAEAIKKVVYDKWTFYPGKYYWVTQLHKVKAIYEGKV